MKKWYKLDNRGWWEGIGDAMDALFHIAIVGVMFVIFTLGYCSRDFVDIIKSHTIVKKEAEK